jgi:hypothetical protein
LTGHNRQTGIDKASEYKGLPMRFSFLAVFLALTGAPALAQNQPVVVELYTSQGCNSCPPADMLLGMLTERDDVIALSLHVDYWDYLGWADTLAHPSFTKRQRSFARSLGERTVFTPQMIVQGSASIVGSHERDLERQIREARSAAPLVNISADRDPGKVSISLSPTGASAPESVIYCVEYSALETVEIERGENAGKRIDYANVVRSWRKIGEWDGRSQKTISAELMGGMPVVVIVQEKGTGPILAAMKVR